MIKVVEHGDDNCPDVGLGLNDRLLLFYFEKDGEDGLVLARVVWRN